MVPERAIPAAAHYLAGMERKFGGRDWAIFAYHCGQGCVGMMQEITRRARGIPTDKMTVARMFFAASPAWNRELYDAIQQQMQRDYSPTYWFRIRRAEQLLALYRRDPAEFARLAQEYKSEFVDQRARAAPAQRVAEEGRPGVPQRRRYSRRAGPEAGEGAGPARLFRLLPAACRPIRTTSPRRRPRPSARWPTSPSRRGACMKRWGRRVRSVRWQSRHWWSRRSTRARRAGRKPWLTASGHVFDIDYSALPPAELECLRFVLSDLGWEGYLGFVEDGMDSLHIGCSPGAREFFTKVFQEAAGKAAGDIVIGGEGK